MGKMLPRWWHFLPEMFGGRATFVLEETPSLTRCSVNLGYLSLGLSCATVYTKLFRKSLNIKKIEANLTLMGYLEVS